MRKTIREKWQKISQEGKDYQKMAAFFWYSDRTSDEDKYWLNYHLESFEDMLKHKNEQSDFQTELNIIHMQLRIDAVQLFAESHPDLKQAYTYSTNAQMAYQEWLKFSARPQATKLLIKRRTKPSTDFIQSNAKECRVKN